MLLRRKMVIGIALLLLIGALYLIITDIIRKHEKGIMPCCENIEIAVLNQEKNSLTDADTIG